MGKDTMNEKFLFSLENCIKCTQTKELLADRNDIEIVTFPHDINEWDDEQLNDAKSHDVFEDLQKTAPILWIDGEKKIGYLRIRKWLQDIEKQD
jgi:glutaredoxin